MTGNEGALNRAVHGVPGIGEGPRAGSAYARARDSVAPVVDITRRSRRSIGARYGQPVAEPSPDAVVGAEKTRLRDGLKSVRLWRDGLPSQRGVKADYQKGLEDARDALGLFGVVVYRAFGWPARALNVFAAVLHVSTQRPGRFAALFLIVLITGIAVLIAVI